MGDQLSPPFSVFQTPPFAVPMYTVSPTTAGLVRATESEIPT